MACRHHVTAAVVFSRTSGSSISLAIFVGLFLMLMRTRIGLIVQAALTHPNMVAHLGHNVPLVFMSVFGVGAGLAAIAGVIAGPALVTQSTMAALLGPTTQDGLARWGGESGTDAAEGTSCGFAHRLGDLTRFERGSGGRASSSGEAHSQDHQRQSAATLVGTELYRR